MDMTSGRWYEDPRTLMHPAGIHGRMGDAVMDLWAEAIAAEVTPIIAKSVAAVIFGRIVKKVYDEASPESRELFDRAFARMRTMESLGENGYV